MKQFFYFIVITLGLTNICAAQTQPLVQPQHVHSELNQLFQAARRQSNSDSVRQYAQHTVQQLLQTNSAARASRPTTSTKNVSRSSTIKATGKAPQGTAQYPWQLLLFVATDEQRLPATLARLRGQITAGTLYQAVVLDTTTASKKFAKLHFLYREGNRVRTQTKQLATTVSTDELLDTLLANFKQDSLNRYTGVIVSAHGSGMDMFYKDTAVEPQEILAAAKRHSLKLDVLEMDSCHMNSLYTTLYAIQSGVVDFISGSSDYEYPTPQTAIQFPLLGFLRYAPQDAVRLSVNRRVQFFPFWEGGYATTSYAALEIAPLRVALGNWYKRYTFLRLSAPKTLSTAFDHFFKDDDTWHSLSYIVQKQKEYVEKHKQELTSQYPKFDQIMDDFLAASQDLLQALDKATLSQWCYSARTDRVYKQTVPLHNDCLQSISVNRPQLKYLWEEQTEALHPEWKTFISWRWLA